MSISYEKHLEQQLQAERGYNSKLEKEITLLRSLRLKLGKTGQSAFRSYQCACCGAHYKNEHAPLCVIQLLNENFPV